MRGSVQVEKDGRFLRVALAQDAPHIEVLETRLRSDEIGAGLSGWISAGAEDAGVIQAAQ